MKAKHLCNGKIYVCCFHFIMLVVHRPILIFVYEWYILFGLFIFRSTSLCCCWRFFLSRTLIVVIFFFCLFDDRYSHVWRNLNQTSSFIIIQRDQKQWQCQMFSSNQIKLKRKNKDWNTKIIRRFHARVSIECQ